jgi:hypothetical protein
MLGPWYVMPLVAYYEPDMRHEPIAKMRGLLGQDAFHLEFIFFSFLY